MYGVWQLNEKDEPIDLVGLFNDLETAELYSSRTEFKSTVFTFNFDKESLDFKR